MELIFPILVASYIGLSIAFLSSTEAEDAEHAEHEDYAGSDYEQSDDDDMYALEDMLSAGINSGNEPCFLLFSPKFTLITCAVLLTRLQTLRVSFAGGIKGPTVSSTAWPRYPGSTGRHSRRAFFDGKLYHNIARRTPTDRRSQQNFT